MTKNIKTFDDIVLFIRNLYQTDEFIPLHEPRFIGNEKKYVAEAIDSTFVSSVGPFVNKFEESIASIAGAKHAVAIVNGTSALHLALIMAGVKEDEEVLTQALTFIATTNAISYVKARPVFIDIDSETLGMSHEKLQAFLEKFGEKRSDGVYNKSSGRKIAAIVPMHTFGMPCRIVEIAKISKEWGIKLVEDSAESIGSMVEGVHTGVFGDLGVFSLNGNKTVTCGGGGAIVTNDESIAKRAKHLSTQAKIPHPWNFEHDSIGYNYRLPNLNAAMACAQLEQLPYFIEQKRELTLRYSVFFKNLGIDFLREREGVHSNYWLNAILLEDKVQRDEFLKYSNDKGVMTRPAWSLMSNLEMFKNCQHDDLTNSRYVEDRLVNIPSSVIVK